MREEIPQKTRANSVYTSSPGSEVQIKQCEGVNILGEIRVFYLTHIAQIYDQSNVRITHKTHRITFGLLRK